MIRAIEQIDRIKAAATYRALGLPWGARAVERGRFDSSPAVQAKARARRDPEYAFGLVLAFGFAA